ncbi:MAG: amidohydrolase family protein [Hydrogenophaga sp.]|nr:amidohydrolase family protein [Hydrogenophaga sp.]
MGWVDCHFHVIEPSGSFPMLPERSYTPREAPLDAWRAKMAPLGFTHGVVVQPSFYGTDNTVLLNTLAQAGGALAGVGAVQDDATESQLDALALAGVRGLRFAHLSVEDARRLQGFVPLSALRGLAPRMRARGMHVNLLTDSRLLPDIESDLREAQLPVVLDHMGRAPAVLGVQHPGVSAMKKLLDQGWLWVKLSGVANVSSQAPGYEDAHELHAHLVSHCPDRLVWGSDWPHTRPKGNAPSTDVIFQRFLDWTSSSELQFRILNTNPLELYRFPRV